MTLEVFRVRTTKEETEPQAVYMKQQAEISYTAQKRHLDKLLSG